MSEEQKLLLENQALRKQIRDMQLDEQSASFCRVFFLILLGVFLGYFWHFTQTEHRVKALENQYKIYKESIVESKEYQAITKCSNEDYFKADCIAFELERN